MARVELTEEEKRRYSRQIMLSEVGLEGQQKLKASKVLIIGAGGLGVPVIQYLTACGVGTIGTVDDDKVEVHNLQRQVLYNEGDIGQLKAEAAAAKARLMNAKAVVNPYTVRLNPSNALELFADYDLIIDGTDNFPTRYLINDACVILGKPFVFGSILKFEGQVSVFNYRGGPTYRCLFPTAPSAEDSPDCNTIGVVGTLPGIIGTVQANEVVKVILGREDTLSGKLWVFDTLAFMSNVFRFPKNPDNLSIAALQDSYQDNAICEIDAEGLTVEQAEHKAVEGVLLIDVRESFEHEGYNIGGINIPLEDLEADFASEVPEGTDEVVFYCATGRRAKEAQKLMEPHTAIPLSYVKDAI